MNNTLLHIFCFFLVSSLVKSQDVISKIEPFNRINTVSSEYGLVLNSEGKNVYHTISGGDFHNNHKFTIDVSSSLPNNTINEPILTNVFTIDAFKYNEDKRRGARFGFNENFLTDNNQTFVIKKRLLIMGAIYSKLLF